MRRVFDVARRVAAFSAKTIPKKQHPWKLYGVGLAALASAGGVYLYLNPEKIFSKSVEKKFDYAVSYTAKKKIFQLVPMPQVPDFSIKGDEKELSLVEWAEMVGSTMRELEKSYLVKTVNYMRETLMEYILNEIPEVELRLRELRMVLPNSLELYLVTESELEGEMVRAGFVRASLLQENIVDSRVAYSINAKLLEVGLLAYPGDKNECFAFVQGSGGIGKLGLDVGDPKSVLVVESLERMRAEFQKLHPMVQRDIMERVVVRMIGFAGKSAESKVKYQGVLEKQIFERLGGDELLKPMVGHLGAIFNALPVRLQAKILIGTLRESRDNLSYLRGLLSNTGIVAIKFGQIVAEDPDPKIPVEYKEMLAGLRDSNDAMGLTEFWKSIPDSIRSGIESLGPLLGVGSVKQVHMVCMVDGGKKVVAVVRKNIEDDAVAMIKALRSLRKIDGLVNRIEKLVFHEMDLWLEYDAFEHLRRKTSFGSAGFILIPNVEVNTLNCLIRDMANGDTLAKILKYRHKFDASPFKEKILKHIGELHRIAILTAFEEGFVMSDLHFGNIVYDHVKDKLVIFDPGQNDTLSKEQAKALLWTMVVLTDKKRMRRMKTAVLGQLKKVGTYEKGLEKKFDAAFDSCVELPDLRARFFQLLIATEREGIILPNAFFAAAKMLDTLQSHETLLNLPNNVEKQIGDLFWKNTSIGEKCRFVVGSIV
ncbi:MAG: hypothetical protein Hyperionvirus13_26 [Hyperionvirus sp.]|uniref:ABC1 atypical kinase-like domain-containing protein n=1 Tax=Hyperionvirus sp. TaxID=2487770 RepID=A0A3G5ADB2_9VIRU|nr:MAG: hypothetical protein Hyperionvirus13_26 [Hyperionvirus sp.]